MVCIGGGPATSALSDAMRAGAGVADCSDTALGYGDADFGTMGAFCAGGVASGALGIAAPPKAEKENTHKIKLAVTRQRPGKYRPQESQEARESQEFSG